MPGSDSPGIDLPNSIGAVRRGRVAGPVRSGNVSPGRRALVLAVLCISLLIVSLDNTIFNVALPTIVRSMHASSSELQ